LNQKTGIGTHCNENYAATHICLEPHPTCTNAYHGFIDAGFLNAKVLSTCVSHGGNDLGNYIYKLGAYFITVSFKQTAVMGIRRNEDFN
jgi:hypothetical protein